jgi:hypothetical protein
MMHQKLLDEEEDAEYKNGASDHHHQRDALHDDGTTVNASRSRRYCCVCRCTSSPSCTLSSACVWTCMQKYVSARLYALLWGAQAKEGGHSGTSASSDGCLGLHRRSWNQSTYGDLRALAASHSIHHRPQHTPLKHMERN